MKKMLYTGTAIAMVLAASCNSPQPANELQSNASAVTPDSLVKRGAYLVAIMNCNDCHSPKIMTEHGPQPDTTRLLSGYPAGMPLPKIDTSQLQSWVLFNHTETATVGPWGVSFAANITSDATGIGNWTEAQFIKCLREGKLKGMDNTRPLLPPMPWPGIAKASDEDLKAIFAYLKSVPPVQNRVPAPIAPNELATAKQ